MINNNMNESFLYAISSNNQKPVKLGISKNPLKRVKQLQTGHSEKLSLYHTEKVPADKVRLYENILHKDLSLKRKQGEWFDVTVEEAISYIKLTLIENEPSELIP